MNKIEDLIISNNDVEYIQNGFQKRMSLVKYFPDLKFEKTVFNQNLGADDYYGILCKCFSIIENKEYIVYQKKGDRSLYIHSDN